MFHRHGSAWPASLQSEQAAAAGSLPTEQPNRTDRCKKAGGDARSRQRGRTDSVFNALSKTCIGLNCRAGRCAAMPRGRPRKIGGGQVPNITDMPGPSGNGKPIQRPPDPQQHIPFAAYHSFVFRFEKLLGILLPRLQDRAFAVTVQSWIGQNLLGCSINRLRISKRFLVITLPHGHIYFQPYVF
jgi:hypothetical protein